MPLRILHISDLHERAAFDGMPASRKPKLEWDARERGLVLGEKFFESLREIGTDGVDLVCLTGDVVDWGHPSEYEAATVRLNEILEVVDVPPDRLFVVPGNHDIQRTVNPEAWEGIRKWYAKMHNSSPLGKWLALVGEPPSGIDGDWRDGILKREAAFWRWTKDFGCPNIQPSESMPLGYRYTFPAETWTSVDVPIHIIGLDSAWLCGDNNDHSRILLTDEQVLAHVRCTNPRRSRESVPDWCRDLGSTSGARGCDSRQMIVATEGGDHRRGWPRLQC